MLRKRVERRVL